ncbi:MAG: hypothetical protein KF773_23430 [Deltaproteobacteria bacterium]|nr:hypothetical protein [Deltaproteobacteria bacterium]
MRALVILVLLAGSAHADELDRAKQLEAALEYEQALAIVDVLLAKGGADPGRFVELEMFAGRLAGGLDRAQAAEGHFVRALSVWPDAGLPDGSSPKITAPFAAARARARPLQVKVVTGDDAVAIDVVDPVDLVRRIEVTVEDAARATRVERGPRVALRAGDTPTSVIALDERGNRVWVGAAPPRPVKPPSPTRPGPRRGLFARPVTWFVLAGYALAGGGFAAYMFRRTQADFDRRRDEGGHDFTELEKLERVGGRYGTIANVHFGAALATGLVGAFLMVRGARDRRPAAVTWHYTGSGFAVAGRF